MKYEIIHTAKPRRSKLNMNKPYEKTLGQKAEDDLTKAEQKMFEGKLYGGMGLLALVSIFFDVDASQFSKGAISVFGLGMMGWAASLYFDSKRAITYDIIPRLRMHKPDSIYLFDPSKHTLDDTTEK